MGEQDPAPETDAPVEDPAPVTEPPADDRLPDYHPVVKALKKANDEAAAARLRVKEFEDAQKTAEERQADQLVTAQQERDAAKAETAILQAAIDHGLSKDDLELLGTHGTPEEIDQRAAKLAARLSTVVPERKADPTQGGADDPAPSLDEQIAEATEKGDISTVIALNTQKLAKAGT